VRHFGTPTLCLVLLGGIGLLYVSLAGKAPTPNPPDAPADAIAGGERTTRAGWYASGSAEAMERFLSASMANDARTVERMKASGDVFPLPAGRRGFIVHSAAGWLATSAVVEFRTAGDDRTNWTVPDAFRRDAR
jgi:hypothetical protein